MNKKLGLRMAQGGLVQGDERAALYAKYGIKPFCPVDEKGYMHLGAGDPCDDKFYAEANDIVVDLLAKNGHLLKEEDIVHSYPHDWRQEAVGR